jgi:hypothetical protein
VEVLVGVNLSMGMNERRRRRVRRREGKRYEEGVKRKGK